MIYRLHAEIIKKFQKNCRLYTEINEVYLCKVFPVSGKHHGYEVILGGDLSDMIKAYRLPYRDKHKINNIRCSFDEKTHKSTAFLIEQHLVAICF